jgi:RecA-family ATPase
VNTFGATGATGPHHPELSRTDLEMLEGARQSAKYGGTRPAVNASAPGQVVPLNAPGNDNAAPKSNGHFGQDVAKAYGQTTTAAEEEEAEGQWLSGSDLKTPERHEHASAPSFTAAPAPAPMPPAEAKNDTWPPQQTIDARPPQGKPIPIPPNFAHIPEELRARPNWVMWRYMPPKGKSPKWRKVPYQPNSLPADTTDKSTWTTFDECCAAYTRGKFDGVGFVFDGALGPDGLCYVGVDFDGCIADGKLDPLAARRIKQLNTYTEASVSRTGVHSIARGKLLDYIVKFDGVEIYSTARYFTFTGCKLLPDNQVVRAIPAEISALTEEVRAKEAATKQVMRPSVPGQATSERRSASTVLFDPAERPDPAFDFDPTADESLSDGIESASWFDALSPDQKDQVVGYATGMVAKSKCFEIEANGGNNAMWYKVTTAIAESGAPHAEDIFVEYASRAKDADSEDELRQHFARCQRTADGRITVGTLLGLARQHGADFDQWERQAPNNTPPLPLSFLNIKKWDGEPIPPREWAVPDRIPLRQVSLFSGQGGAGKSHVTLHLCVAHALGRDWLGSNPIPGPAIFVDAEDDENEIRHRLSSILRHYDASFTDAANGGLHLLSLVGQDAILATAEHNGRIVPTKLYDQLFQAAGDIEPKMIGIASSANVFAGNENDRGQVQQFVSLLTGLARVAGGSVQLISHPSLTGINTKTGLSGSTQWHNAVRARSYLHIPNATEDDQQPDSDLRVYEFMKVQYGSLPGKINLRYQDGMFLPDRSPLSLPKQAKQAMAAKVFLELLGKFDAQNRTVSDKPSRSYAPTVFAKEAEAKQCGLTKDDLADAMRLLFSANKIWNKPIATGTRPQYCIAIGINPARKGSKT